MSDVQSGRKKGIDLPKSKKGQRLKGRSFLLGIGINDYSLGKGGFLPLYNAVRDVKEVTGLLYRMYDFEEPHLLVDGDATRTGIINAIHDYVKQLSSKDSLLIYYSGHGLKEMLNAQAEQSYWVPYDAIKGEPGSLISNDQILSYLKRFQARHILLISDSCFSGSFLQSKSEQIENFPLQEERAIKLESEPSRWGLSSGRRNEVVADGTPGSHSPFASAIIHTIRNGSSSFINIASFSEQVANRTQFNYEGQTVLGKPIPGCNDQGGQFIFWKRPHPIPRNADDKDKAETKQKPVKRAIPKLDFIEDPVSSTIPLITIKNVYTMEQSLRKTCQLMLSEFQMPLHADRWVIRDFCENKLLDVVDLLKQTEQLREKLDALKVSGSKAFQLVVGIKQSFDDKFDRKHFRFMSNIESGEVSKTVDNSLETLAFNLKECERIVRETFEEDEAQKSELSDYLVDASVHLQLLYHVFKSIIDIADQHDYSPHQLN